jgi:hypothetical protein
MLAAVRRRRLITLSFVIAVAACGSRTALLVDPIDAGVDGSRPNDAGPDRRDAPGDAPQDRLPPIDVVVPDVITPLECADAAITYIYLLSSAGDLLSFNPTNLGIKTIGKVQCKSVNSPNSMAVDHLGVAYANYYGNNTGEMFKLSTSTAACSPTTYTPQFGFTKFGMGFVGDQDGGETLFIADTVTDPSGALASVDTKTFKLGYVGQFSPALPRCELTGTGDGRLFAFCMDDQGSTLAQIDPKTAKVVGADKLNAGGAQAAFAFGFWGGDFYLFTGNSGSDITKFDPVNKKETVVGTTVQLIVGAGVSTCAPL